VDQIDGLADYLFGVRVERDVMALSLDESVCSTSGLTPFECLGEVASLFYAPMDLMPQVTAAAKTHDACGVFVLLGDADPWPVYLQAPKKENVLWRDALRDASVFTFLFYLPVHGECVAVLANFGANANMRKSRRKGFKVGGSLEVKAFARKNQPLKLGVIARLPHRASPFAHEPSPADDVAARSPAFVPQDTPPVPNPTAWDVSRFAEMAADYPFEEVVKIGLSVMDGTANPFRGDLTKTVDMAPAELDEDYALSLRDITVKQIASGQQAGPYSVPPVANARPVNILGTKKSKYDEMCKRLRQIHHFSEPPEGFSGDVGSINRLCYSPKWIASHLTARRLFNRLASLGRGTKMSYDDVPSAFKRNPTNMDLLCLAISQLKTQKFGLEYFVELSNTFGWTPSEWGWQACLALMMWWLEKEGVDEVYPFVDNFFHLHPPGTDMKARAARARECYSSMGTTMHESGEGTYCEKTLGWEVDLDYEVCPPLMCSMVMICPAVKRTFYTAMFKKLTANKYITTKEVKKINGISQFLSTGFPAAMEYLPAIQDLCDTAERNILAVGKRQGRHAAQDPCMVKCTLHAREALNFFTSVLAGWDGVAPIMAGFGPQTPSEIDGWVDAATNENDGCGGVFWNPQTRELLGFFHAWNEEERELAKAEGAKRESTGVLEALGALRWMERFGMRCRQRRTLLRVDNQALMKAYRITFSKVVGMQIPIRAMRRITAKMFMTLRMVWVPKHACLSCCFSFLLLLAD
jgi:hypothetical protein